MSAEIIDRDMGWANFFSRAWSIKTAGKVKVGVLADTEKGGLHEEGGQLTVAEIAVVNEFGTENGNIPARPFVRPSFDAEHEELVKMAGDFIEQILDGKIKAPRALGIMGAYLAAKIKSRVQTGVPPANAPSTILHKAMKGRTGKFFKKKVGSIGGALAQIGALAAVKTLIDTGRMINAITWIREQSINEKR